MKIDVIVEGARKELDLRGLKGKEIDKLMDTLMQFQEAGEDKVKENYLKLRTMQKEYACKVSGLSTEQLDELDSDDRAKIYDYINEKLNNAMGFSKLLSR